MSDSIIPHYETHAHAWEADRRHSPWNDKPWHDRFIAALPDRARVLDLGCGAGVPVASHLATCGVHVTGLDTSPSLISLCRNRMPDHRWIVGDMRSPPIRETFDGILAWDSFFHLNPDHQRLMFRVFADHSAASTLLMFNAGPAHGEAVGTYKGDLVYHASLDPSEYEMHLDQAGFDVIAHAVEDRDAGGRTVWLSRSRNSY